MQLNYSQKFNAALLQELKIKYLVTKESGAAGGYPEKVKAARSVGVEVLVLERPQIDYPELVYSIKDVLLFIQKYNS